MQALTGHVTGRVQGVGFRWSTRHQADLLGVTGWVRNRIDGSVEVFAQGDSATLDAFRAYLAEGPRHASVAAVRLRAAEPDPTITSFAVR
jgi:acylphosphatase